MTVELTPTEESYIAANEAMAATQQAAEIAFIVASVAMVVLGAIVVRYFWRRQPVPCGEHQFTARQDYVRDGDQWRPIYVRDVCTYCGVTVERTDARFDKPDFAEKPQ